MVASSQFDFHATLRTDTGRKATRKLRAQDKVPAIVYGANQTPEAIVLAQKEVSKKLAQEGVYSHILNLHIEGNTQKVVIKAVERNQIKSSINHLDFYRIQAGEKITMNVPVHFTGQEQAPGIKDGGVVSHLMNDIEIRCLPEHLPEAITVDLSQLTIGMSIHLNEVTLPKDVELTTEITEDHNPAVATMYLPREEVEEEKPIEEVIPEEGEITGEAAGAEGESKGEGEATPEQPPESE